MKTIATAAVLMMLTTGAWADEPESKQTATNEPIVLSEADMDGVTAGVFDNTGTLLAMERSFSVGSSTSSGIKLDFAGGAGWGYRAY